MDGNRMRNALGMVAALVLLGGVTGCFRVHVDKDANGEDKNVQVDTPFGGVHVNTNQTSAADLGLPVYPGAKPADACVVGRWHRRKTARNLRCYGGKWTQAKRS